MNYLSVEKVSKTFADKALFQDVSFGIQKGEKIVLVGDNGTGKSTLLKMITGKIAPDVGDLNIRKEIRVAHLLQVPDFEESASVFDCLYDKNNPVAVASLAYNQVMANPNTDDQKMQEAMHQMEELNAWSFDSRVHEVANRLGIYDFDQQVSTLSGGQRKRIALAQILLSDADFLIFDEPTNHLDIEAIEWLEKYLSQDNITLLMVSHDRYFIDNVVNTIYEIDMQKLFIHKGNYAKYLENKSLRYEIEAKEVSKAKQLYKKELEWMRRQPKARGTKAQYRIDAFGDIKKKAKKDISKAELTLDIKESRQGKNIIEVKNISKSFDGKTILKDFSYTFKKHEKIGIVGKNGSGKSTFLNMLAGQLQPDHGEVIKGVTTKIGYFTQVSAHLNDENRVIDEVKEIAEFITIGDGKQLSASKLLETFLFDGKKQYSYISKLSGGERKRLQLLKNLILNPNFLILDEPTNDLDIDTLNVLEEFLQQFTGCLLLVSHDRYFMDQLVEHLFVLEGDGTIKIKTGNYSDYIQNISVEGNKQSVLKKGQQKDNTKIQKTKEKSGQNKLSYKEKKEYEGLEDEIDQLESKRDNLMEKLNGGNASSEELNNWSKEIGILSKEIDLKTERWVELGERI